MSRTEPSAYSQSATVAHASVNVALASFSGWLTTGIPAWCCRSNSATRNSTRSSESIGANDEHFRKNHERDLRHQGGCGACGRRRGCGWRIGAERRLGRCAATVDVAPILDAAVKAKGEKLEWRTSIVDLMKALDIDSSFTARKELAKELGYTGDSNNSASMNIWLHKQVMTKLAANGGKLPPEIKH